MDIFTTVLTKVRATPIKPEKLRVKALKKEPETHELSDDLNHLEDHDIYLINEKKHSKDKERHPQSKSESKKVRVEVEEHEFTDDNIIPSESVITDKQEILHPNKVKNSDEPAKDIKHLDIFI
ncbi:MAG: hypothetical protein KC484_04180 [Colwelliaceae bacterium]|nr:hypothetical protein [Colwelliaceae bacterium]